jgi:hypothetical protein
MKKSLQAFGVKGGMKFHIKSKNLSPEERLSQTEIVEGEYSFCVLGDSSQHFRFDPNKHSEQVTLEKDLKSAFCNDGR